MKRWLVNLHQKSWTIKFVPASKKEASILNITGVDLLRIGILFFLISLVIVGYLLVTGTQAIAKMQNMAATIKVRNSQLNTLQKQKLKIETLLNQRAQMLQENIAELRAQEAKIEKLLGRKAQKKISFKASKSLKSAHQLKLAYVVYRFAHESSRGNPTYDGLILELASLEKEVAIEKFQLKQVGKLALRKHEEFLKDEHELRVQFNDVPHGWPVSRRWWISSQYGWRINPVLFFHEFHKGVDIAVAYGRPIHATAGGVVVYSGWGTGYGEMVEIDHENGYETIYSHCSRLLVSAGESVERGQVIGLIGSTGWSTGPHIYYCVRYDHQFINPNPYLNLTFQEYVKWHGLTL
jgi:murein DD-endopeptidase MepM/ murein hydrolase activator NlpD